MAKEEKGKGKPEGSQEGLLTDEELEDITPLDNDPGGPPPSKSILKLGSHKKDIANQFKEGEEAVFQVHARCEYIGFGGGKRVQEFDVLDIFQDEDLDESIIERFKDHLEAYEAPKKTKEAITAFLEACLEEPDGDDSAPEEPGAPAPEEPEPPAEEPKAKGEEAKADSKPEPPAAVEEPPVEEVDGEIVPEPDAPALEDAAGDLDWGEDGAPAGD